MSKQMTEKEMLALLVESLNSHLPCLQELVKKEQHCLLSESEKTNLKAIIDCLYKIPLYAQEFREPSS